MRVRGYGMLADSQCCGDECVFRNHYDAIRGRIFFSNAVNEPRTCSPVSITSLCDSFSWEMPAAKFVTQDMPIVRMPICAATIASGTVDIPTRSAPIVR